MAGSGGGLTMRDTVSCTSAGAGRTELPWGRRERQADGSPAEGHPRFFWNTFPAAAPPQPTIPASSDARSREPSPRATSSGTPPAFSRAQASPDRASGGRGGGSGSLAAGGRRRAGDEDGGTGISPKILMAPCRASIPLPFPTRPRTRRATPRPPPCPDTIHCIAGHPAVGDRHAQFATRSAMNLFPGSGMRMRVVPGP
jgi:hypothetical protein